MIRNLFPGAYLFSCMIVIVSCVKKIDPPIYEGRQQLVVEGMITTDPVPYQIKLSYTGDFLYANVDSNQHFINDAIVVIKDDQGDSTSCGLTAPGTYQTNDSGFIGRVGISYTLEIYLSNGNSYVSAPEKINPVPPIDSITVVYDSTFITDVRPTQLIISVNTHDPSAEQNYYRWIAFGYIPRLSTGTGGFYIGAECEQFLAENTVNVLSDQFINGKEIIQPVFYSPLYWHGTHYLEIQQYSVSLDIFQFWQQYLQQTDRTGGILDPLPASLTGNIYNKFNPNDIVLGAFAASAVVTKKVKIIPFFLQDYYLMAVAGEFVAQGDCHLVYPNSLPDDTGPDGWQNAEEIDLH